MRRMSLTVLIGTVLLGAKVFALDFMGPTTSRLESAGQSSVGAEYFWSNMGIEADAISDLPFPLSSDTIEDVDSGRVSANVAVGMGRSSEIFLRLGISDADPDKGENRDNVAGYIGNSDETVLIGGGAKWTLYQGKILDWGLLVQTSWADYDFDRRSYSIAGNSVEFSTSIEVFETQIATGPTIAVRKNVALYGGPFLCFLRGDAELKGSINGLAGKVTTDLEEESLLGFYIGAQVDLGKHAYFGAEFQTMDDNYGVGGNLVWRF